MDDNNCNANHIMSNYKLSFLGIEDNSFLNYNSIFLDGIGVEIYFSKKGNEKAIDLMIDSKSCSHIRFEWFGTSRDFDKLVKKISRENDYTESGEYKILEEFLSFAESITNQNVLYTKIRVKNTVKYNLR